MLRTVKDDLKKNYYDTNFHGMDVEARFSAADAKIKEAESVGQLFGTIAEALVDLNDSHTYFLPPRRASRTEYGWQMQAFGDKIFVSAVKPGSDAEMKGLKTGDQVLSVNGFEPSRDQLWKMIYLFYTLRPHPGLRLVLRRPDGVSVTNANVIMADGKSLEGVGVKPDELLLPTAADLAAKRDPVLARAAAIVGFELPPDKAGAMFPVEWRK